MAILLKTATASEDWHMEWPREWTQRTGFDIGSVRTAPHDEIRLNWQQMMVLSGFFCVYLQAFFSCKTQKPSSEFWKTQIAKFLKNPVLSQKPSSKIVKNSVFPQNSSKNQLNLAKLSSKFPKTQFRNCKNPVFQKTWKAWISRYAHNKSLCCYM